MADSNQIAVALRSEINTDPEGLGYAASLATRDDAAIATLMNAPRGTRTISRFCNERTILAEYPTGPIDADIALSKIEAFGSAGQQLSSLVRRAMKYVGQPDGLDFGSPATIAMLGALAQGGVITEAEMNGILKMAHVPSSRAIDLFGTDVSSHGVTVALNGDI